MRIAKQARLQDHKLSHDLDISALLMALLLDVAFQMRALERALARKELKITVWDVIHALINGLDSLAQSGTQGSVRNVLRFLMA